MTYVAVGFNSLPSVLRDLIETRNEAALTEELKKLKYSPATKRAAKHYFWCKSSKSK
ncbi:MAG: hypothetical protein HUJ13_01025 [Hydrogenovibrio crunogenus]|nr:hypothetical protein [Hydrogenovibrio crunogenus]